MFPVHMNTLLNYCKKTRPKLDIIEYRLINMFACSFTDDPMRACTLVKYQILAKNTCATFYDILSMYMYIVVKHSTYCIVRNVHSDET